MTSAKTELLDLLREAQAAQRAFVDNLSDAERDASGTFNYADWTAKDVVAHCTFWSEQMHERLATIQRGEVPKPNSDEDIDRLNAQAYQERRDRSWSEVLADSEKALQTLIDDISQLDDDQILKTGYFAQPDGTIWRSVLGNSYSHSTQHYTDYYLFHGDMARAGQLQEDIVRTFNKSSNLESQGTAKYNLACFYARTNQPDRAILLLREALQLAPSLTDWSKQDSDLVSLHDKPEYQALYAGA